MRLLADGMPLREIARRLYISERTVSAYLDRIRAKAGVTSRGALRRAILRSAGDASEGERDRWSLSPTGGGASPRPYDALVDPDELVRLNDAVPGGAALVLGMIKSDMEWQAKRIDMLDEHEHKTRLLSIWLTMVVVLGIAAMATMVILAGFQIAGSILATVDLVALANVFVNSWRRADPTSVKAQLAKVEAPTAPATT